jgi:hypothetical protein
MKSRVIFALMLLAFLFITANCWALADVRSCLFSGSDIGYRLGGYYCSSVGMLQMLNAPDSLISIDDDSGGSFVYGGSGSIPIGEKAGLDISIYGNVSTFMGDMENTGVEVSARMLLLDRDRLKLYASLGYVRATGVQYYYLETTGDDYFQYVKCTSDGARLPITLSYDINPALSFTACATANVEFVSAIDLHRIYDTETSEWINAATGFGPNTLPHGGFNLLFHWKPWRLTVTPELGTEIAPIRDSRVRFILNAGLSIGVSL